MAGDTTPPIQSLIREFEERARWRQKEAYWFLVLMLLGIVAAGLVFWFAKSITESETAIDIPKKIASVNELITENNRRSGEQAEALGNAYSKLLQDLPTIAKESCNHIFAMRLSDAPSLFFRDKSELRSKADFINDLVDLVSRVNAKNSNIQYDCISFTIPYFPPATTATTNI
jgi:hypothetical protein